MVQIISNMKEIICIEDLNITRKDINITFRKNEEYSASRINNKWWIVEQIGIDNDTYEKYFIEKKSII